MKKKILIPTTIAFSIMLFISIVNAQMIIIPEVSVRTDKPQYLPGGKGTIYITFYNDRSNPLSIHNITVIYHQWQAYMDNKWVGNKTIEVDLTVKEHGIKSLDPVDFTVPSDGRAEDCDVTVQIGTTQGFEYGYATIYVVETLYYMEQIVMLFTILVVLTIVCTIIIAATIFLSARRPQVTWKREEKVE